MIQGATNTVTIQFNKLICDTKKVKFLLNLRFTFLNVFFNWFLRLRDCLYKKCLQSFPLFKITHFFNFGFTGWIKTHHGYLFRGANFDYEGFKTQKIYNRCSRVIFFFVFFSQTSEVWYTYIKQQCS